MLLNLYLVSLPNDELHLAPASRVHQDRNQLWIPRPKDAMRPDGDSEETLVFVAGFENQLKRALNELNALNNNHSTDGTSVLTLRTELVYLLLLNLSLRVVVDGLLGIRQILFSILDVGPFKHNTGAAGEDQFLPEANHSPCYYTGFIAEQCVK